MLDLYHHGSSACAAKTRFALLEKQLAWNGHIVDIFRGEQFRPEFLALNPKAVVPMLPPYVNRIAALSMEVLWQKGRLSWSGVCSLSGNRPRLVSN